MKHLFSLLILCSFLIRCADSPKSKAIPPKPFPRITLPMMVASDKQDYGHLAINFWDKYIDSVKVFSKDTSLIGGVTKDAFRNAYYEYVNALHIISKESYIKAQKKLVRLIEKTQQENPNSNVFESVVSITEDFLYGVNSNFRNEELYIPFLEDLINSPQLDPILKEKYTLFLKDCMLNRIGSIAKNFSFHTKEGKIRNLHQIKSDYTFLFFSNPGCQACFDIMENIEKSPKISKLITSGELTMINMYIDEDLTAWFEYMQHYPQEWINAYDQEMNIRKDLLYDIRAIPSIYLLDKEKRVIYKDAHYPMAIHYLENLN